jgi:hypothetical protein
LLGILSLCLTFMKQPFICIASLALLFAACKKDDDTTTPVVVTKYLQSIVADNGDSTAVEFNMDKSVYKFIVFGADDSYRATIPSYESGTGNITKVEVTTDPLTYNTYVHQVITYNSLQNITTVSVYNSDGSLAKADSLIYSTTGKLDTLYYYELNDDTNLKELRKKYVQTWDAKGNIVKQEEIYVNAEGGSTITTYTYDNKINPALKVTGYYLVNFDEDQLAGLLSANNIVTSSSVNAGNGYTASAKNTYEYDTDDYPAVMTLRSQSQYTGQDLRSDSVKLKLYYGQ